METDAPRLGSGNLIMFRTLVFFLLILTCAVSMPCQSAAQNTTQVGADAAPFASNLFQGHFSGEKNAVIQPGDRLVVRLWGPVTFDGVLTVDPEGFITLPDNVRLMVQGLGQLPKTSGTSDSSVGQATALEQAISSKLKAGGQTGQAPAGETGVYARLLDSQPVTVLVTGFVPQPGSYSGTAKDTVLAFLDKAGGIDPARGSYRRVRVLRQGREVAMVDLYPFALEGVLPQVRFQDGDTVVVDERGPVVTVSGSTRHAARFEFTESPFTGDQLLKLANPLPGTTHAALTGTRSGSPYSLYLPLDGFRAIQLAGGDTVRLQADRAGDTITVETQGAVRGGARIPVRRNAKLRDVLPYIAVDPDRANLDGLHIKRKSVAARQKKAIEDSLRRLEQNAYTATSASAEEAQIRAKEAEMLSSFISKAREAAPDGVVVVGKNRDLALEDGDVIVIPEKTDVVLVSGEVMMPQAMVWDADRELKAYISSAGGFSNRADTDSILVLRPGGNVLRKPQAILPGDQILVLPVVESKTLQGVKDIAQVLYQVAVACKVILDF